MKLAVIRNLRRTPVGWSWSYEPASFVLERRRWNLGKIEDAWWVRRVM